MLKDIEEFAPSDGNWRRLDELLDELWSYGVTQGQIPFLFRVFERFPEDDGAGVFWSIVHGVESLTFDYGTYLKESMARRPSHMGAIMLQRLEKATES